MKKLKYITFDIEKDIEIVFESMYLDGVKHYRLKFLFFHVSFGISKFS